MPRPFNAPRPNLRIWREHLSLNQRDVERQLGWQASRIYNLESGRAVLTAQVLTDLAKLYKCSIDDLLHRKPGAKRPQLDTAKPKTITMKTETELGHTERLLREIQRDLADMRDDRTVMVAILERHDATLNTISAEQRALRSQLDRFRVEMREELRQLRDLLAGSDGEGR